MKKVMLLCCLLLATLAWADGLGTLSATAESGEKAGTAVQPASPLGLPYAELDDYARTQLKEHFYLLVGRAEAGLASDAELDQINFMSAKYYFDLPWFMLPQDDPNRDEGNLDQGSVDTVGNCASATVIPACPYNTSGNFDGDNDCSVSAASPYNEVFYTFTPTVTGYYQMRVRSQSGGVAAIRVMGGACCLGATSIAFAANSVSSTDCARPDSAGNEPVSSVTYTRATLTAGVQYWIHVGTSSSTAGIVAAYQFNLWCVPCPVVDAIPQGGHDDCIEAVELACNDSILADSAAGTTPATFDWFKVTLPVGTYDSLIVKVFAREWGHCISGLYPQNATGLVATDCRFSIWKDNGTCPGDSLTGDDDGTHGYLGCSVDAAAGVCAGPGTYYIKVYNFSGQGDYIVTTRCAPCPPPVDCNTMFPCGSPAEVEPNNTCADAVNFIALECLEGVTQEFYGTSCPQNDVDYFFMPGIPAGRQIDVQLFDGPGCDQATGGLSMRGATSSGACGSATGTATRRYLIGQSCYATAPGWFAVVRTSGGESPYKITVTCNNIAPVCPDVVLPKQFCAGPCAVNIPPLGVSSSTQSVSLNEVIDDVNVRINATHSFDGDLIFRLVSPWADTLNLISRRGSSGDNFQITLLDDEATTAISAGVAPFNGSFIPEEPLSQLDGYNALGDWTLICRDTVSGDSGYVLCWCLEFTSHSPCTPTGEVTFQADNDNVGSYPAYWCADLCAGVDTRIVVCSVDGHPLDPTKTPIVTVTPGCNPTSSRCDVPCPEGSAVFSGVLPYAVWYYNDATGCFEFTLSTEVPGCVCICLEGFLGVELSAFDATIGDRQVILNWTTATETNNARFEINRDGILVGSVDGQGTSTTATNYSWTDRELSNGTTYAYTLITVDGNGGRSEVGTINATPTASAVVTAYALSQNFPNPFNPETMISFDLVDAGLVNLKVYNVLGQAVAELVNRNMEAGRHLVSFQAGDLPSGIYLYRLEANGFVAQKKMVLMK